MQHNLKHVFACLFLFVGAIASSANTLPARREVMYGSGYVVKRNFGSCQLDPVCGGLASTCAAALTGLTSSSNTLPARREAMYGSGYVAKQNFRNCQLDKFIGPVCSGLAATCGAAITSSEVTLVWQIVSCTCAALWCGTQMILNILCCLGKLPTRNCDSNNSFTGDKSIAVSQAVIDNIATFADGFGDTFSNADLLHAIQGNGGGCIENDPALVNIINQIMQQLTGDPNGMASLGQVNSYLRSTDFAAGWGS